MKPDEARKLLGGYATGTLTPEEQQALFAAALEDQALFDELAREQVLRETLDEPGTRAELLAAVTEQPRRAWWRWWPVPVGAAALAALTVALLIPREEEPVEIASSSPLQLEQASPQANRPLAAPSDELATQRSREAPARKSVRATAPQPARIEEKLAATEPAPAAAPPPAPLVAGRVQQTMAPPGPAPSQQQAANQVRPLEEARVEPEAKKEIATAAVRDAAAPEGARSVASGFRGDAAVGLAAKSRAAVRGPMQYRFEAGGRLVVTPPSTGQLAVFRREAGKPWTPLAPSPVPAYAGVPVSFEPAAAGEVVIILSREPLFSSTRGAAAVDALMAKPPEGVMVVVPVRGSER